MEKTSIHKETWQSFMKYPEEVTIRPHHCDDVAIICRPAQDGALGVFVAIQGSPACEVTLTKGYSLMFGRNPEPADDDTGNDVIVKLSGSPECDLSYVSRYHGRITWSEDSQVVVADCSSNGTCIESSHNFVQCRAYPHAVSQKPHHDEDTFTISAHQTVFAVFDGVGGSAAGGKEAADIAARVVQDYSFVPTTCAQKAVSSLVKCLEKADKEITQTSAGGSLTTATIARIVSSNKGIPLLCWASVGDSRVYLIRKGTAKCLSVDEGEGHAIWNCLGHDFDIQQFGSISLKKNDFILLATDGITGDYGTDLVSDEELAAVCDTDAPLQHIVDTLVHETARKHDDRTALIVRIE